MSTFEFTFGLISLLLGLGFARIAETFAQLVMAGRHVKWDWLPPLAALNVFQLGLIYWWFQFSIRDEKVILGSMVIKAITCLLIYMMAVAALPEVDAEERVDLRRHFESSRRLFYLCYLVYAFVVGLLPPLYALLSHTTPGWQISALDIAFWLALVAGVFVANRWFQTALLVVLLGMGGASWLFAGLQ